MKELSQEQIAHERLHQYIYERDISIVPIMPWAKRPGRYDKATKQWGGMNEWSKYCKELPTEDEWHDWATWPDLGYGLICGKVSNIVAVDYDNDSGTNDLIETLIPKSICEKRGAKGWTRFFRYNGERSRSFDIQKKRYIDILSDGRQTVIPPTIHPSGCNYVWTTVDTLETITSTNDLPILPDDIVERIEKAIAEYQTPEERGVKGYTKRADEDKETNGELSISQQYYRDLNEKALSCLESWVPQIIPTAVEHKDGYRCIATWRNCENANVGIHPTGIHDFGGNIPHTALNLVMQANNFTFNQAAETLRALVDMGGDRINLTVGAKPIPVGIKPKASMPWEKKIADRPTEPQIYLPSDTSEQPSRAIPNYITNAPGMLGDIARWITTTAPKSQPELSLAAAISLGATIMQRVYRTNRANYTSLYMVMVAKSTEGKEHPQTCVERILTEAGLTNLIAGSGYTSSGAVFSALIKSPSHIAIIDEIGKLLKLSRSKGNANGEAAIDKLVEAYGKLDSIIRPPVYSTMTLKKGAQDPTDVVIHNPAISLLGATTPGTFYQNLTDDLVQDGFLGRLIVVESTQPRQLARFVDQTEPPEAIVQWCQQVHNPVREGDLADLMASNMRANTIPMMFDERCDKMVVEFERELNRKKEEHEPEGLDVLLGRTLEKSLRLSMIAAKACDPLTLTVLPEHLDWAIKFIRHCDDLLIKSVRKNRIANQTDGDVKKIIELVKNAKKYSNDKKYGAILAAGYMPNSKLLKLMKMPAKKLNELTSTCVDMGILIHYNAASLGFDGTSCWGVGDLD